MNKIIILAIALFFYACSEETVAPESEARKAPKVCLTKVDTVRVTDTITVYRDTTIFEVKENTVFITMYFVHPAYIHLVDRFYQEAEGYGWTLPKNNLIVLQWAITDIQENGYPEWYEGDGTSISMQDQTQWYVKLNEILRSEKQFIPLFRELGHVLLGKPYSDNPDEMMCYNFQWFFTEREYDEAIARPYLDKLFEH